MLRSWLDRLDGRTKPPTGLDQRMSRRFEYRAPALALEVSEGEDAAVPHTVVGRNICREGIGVLAGQFIYPRSACRIRLSSPFGSTQDVAGRVVRCRYLLGSGSLYEVGVEFDYPIDVALFAPRARRVRVLLCGADAAGEELIARFLGGENAQLQSVATTVEATAAVAAGDIDLVLVDLDCPASDGFDLARRLRNDGFVGPVLGMTVQVTPEVRDHCTAAGCTGYLIKPLLREQLCSLVAALADQPLLSSLAHDPALAPLIDRFVAGLREKVTEMSRASQLSDLSGLARLVQDLRAQAGSYGFEPISEEAALVQALIVTGAAGEQIRPALQGLMDACLRARPATSPPEPDSATTPLFSQTVAARPAPGRRPAE
jgi:CheY-like chemotaxis protein